MPEEKDKKKALAVGAGLAALAAVLLFALKSKAQDPDKAMLYGQVTDIETGSPVNGIRVECNGYRDTTGQQGAYQILNIEPGTYSVAFTDPLGRYEPKVV